MSNAPVFSADRPMFHVKHEIEKYISLLKEYNEKFNLYSRKSYDRLDFHVTDCLNVAHMISDRPSEVLDIGSGSGLPSAIIAAANPKNNVVAVESKMKKCEFLKIVKEELGLKNYTVVNSDILEYIHKMPKKPDVVTAKAFGPYDKIRSICLKIKKPRLRLIVPISALQAEELKSKKIPISHPQNTDYFYIDQQF